MPQVKEKVDCSFVFVFIDLLLKEEVSQRPDNAKAMLSESAYQEGMFSVDALHFGHPKYIRASTAFTPNFLTQMRLFSCKN